MTEGLCASTTTHAVNVRHCKFKKNARIVGQFAWVRTLPRGSDTVVRVGELTHFKLCGRMVKFFACRPTNREQRVSLNINLGGYHEEKKLSASLCISPIPKLAVDSFLK